MDKTIIISYRESTEERKENLKHVLEYIHMTHHDNVKVLIVEQDAESKMGWLEDVNGYENIKHIFVENDGIFNKGWGYNIGAKNTDAEILIFHDSDMFIKPQTFNSALKALNFCDVVNPYKSIVFLDEKLSQSFTGNNFRIVKMNKPTLTYVITGGIFFMKRKAFLDIKGFDEKCYGYGYEDDILDEKIRKMNLNTKTLNDVAIHIYHSPSNNNDDIYYSFVDVNKTLFKEYKTMSPDKISECINNVIDWGIINNQQCEDYSTRHIKREIYEQSTIKAVDYITSKITDELLDDIVNEISNKIYNDIIESVSEKIKSELSNLKITKTEKNSLMKNIMKKFNF